MASPFLLAPAAHGASARHRIAPSYPPVATRLLAKLCGATASCAGAIKIEGVGIDSQACRKRARRALYGSLQNPARQSSTGTASNTTTCRSGCWECLRNLPLISLKGVPHLYASPKITKPGSSCLASSATWPMLWTTSPVRVITPSGVMIARHPSYLGIMMYSLAGRSSSVGYFFLKAAHCSLSALGARLNLYDI